MRERSSASRARREDERDAGRVDGMDLGREGERRGVVMTDDEL